MNQDIVRKLQAPFPFEEVEAKIQVTNQDKTKGMAVFYIDSRAIQKRLDEVVGMFNWKNQYYPWQNNAQTCGISIFDTERGEWVEKQDGAPNTDIEPIMGGLSHSFKRAACVWSIGRYLYQLDGIWAEIEQRGKGSYIKDNQQGKLKSEYEKAVARIFNTPVTPSNPTKSTQAEQPTAQHPESKQSGVAPFDYQVKSIKPSGKSSQLLELVDKNGEIINAYVKNTDNAIIAGSRLTNVNMEQKTSNYGAYNLISAYQVAA